MFIDKLLFHKKNIKLFLDANGMKILIDLLTLAHLHTTRAYVPTQVCMCTCFQYNEHTSLLFLCPFSPLTTSTLPPSLLPLSTLPLSSPLPPLSLHPY